MSYHTVSEYDTTCSRCKDEIPAGEEFLVDDVTYVDHDICKLCQYDDYPEYDETEERW